MEKVNIDPTIRPLLWSCRKAILDIARKDPRVKELMEMAAEQGLRGDGCFIYLAAMLAGDQERILEKQNGLAVVHYQLRSEIDMLKAKIKYEEARHSGVFSKIKRIFRGKATCPKA